MERTSRAQEGPTYVGLLTAALIAAASIFVTLGFSSCNARVPSARVLPNVLAVRELDSGTHVAGIAAASDDSLWIATLNYGNGFSGSMRLRRDGAIQRFARIESMNRVAVDRAGNAWFTVGAGSSGQQPKLVRLNASGAARDYPLPVEGNFVGIAIGADGAPWFVDATAGEIGRISASGEISYYGPASADPTEITAAKNGDFWFTEPTANAIGHLSPDGSLSEMHLHAGSDPTAITAASDGSIWFCESAANKIGRLAPNRELSEYAVPSADAWPAGIAAAPAGSVWFTELNSGMIGRLSEKGKITEFALPGRGYPGPITTALDGTMWIASNAKRDAVLGLVASRSRLIHFRPR